MIIYKDKISNDELFSDIYPMKLIDGLVWEVEGKFVTESKDVQCDTGSNPSAEGGDDEGADPSSTSGIDVVLANRLVETSYSKKDYLKYIKEYMKSIKAKLEEEKVGDDKVAEFQTKATAFVSQILKRFKDFQFFTGESMDVDGQVVLVEWKDEVPYLYFFKHGLVDEKV